MLSPTLSHQQHVQGSTHASSSDAHLTQAQAASMRRKKNADAQAAFRARRANYIASLEETGALFIYYPFFFAALVLSRLAGY